MAPVKRRVFVQSTLNYLPILSPDFVTSLNIITHLGPASVVYAGHNHTAFKKSTWLDAFQKKGLSRNLPRFQRAKHRWSSCDITEGNIFKLHQTCYESLKYVHYSQPSSSVSKCLESTDEDQMEYSDKAISRRETYVLSSNRVTFSFPFGRRSVVVLLSFSAVNGWLVILELVGRYLLEVLEDSFNLANFLGTKANSEGDIV